MNDCPTNPTDPPRLACQEWTDRRIAAARHDHRFRNAGAFLVALAVIAAIGGGIESFQRRIDRQQHGLAAAVGRLQSIDQRTTLFAPLSNYPPGEVLDRVAGVTGPALAVSAAGQAVLHVVPHVCNHERVTVTVRASLTWLPYDADGRLMEGREFSLYTGVDEARPPGCAPYSAARPFVTPVPVTVATVQCIASVDHWRLLLADTPVRADGTIGRRVEGYTVPFHLIPT